MNQEIENNREEFLTPADFGKNGVSKEELEKINNHPLGDGEKYKGKYRMEKFDSSVDEIEEEREKEKKKQKSEIDGQIVLSEEIIIKKSNNRVDFLDNEKPIGKTPTGLPLYRNEDPGEMYKKAKEKSLLEKTPMEERYFLKPGTFLKGRNKEYNSYRYGSTKEESTVKRFITEEGKWPVKETLHKYIALTGINIFYTKDFDNVERKLSFKPGDIFYAPSSCEDKEKRKKILEKIKKN